ncbi:hypothetical protein [Sphingomonas sp. PB4P5]|uniref:hypothetical protein n=1 Tax=Parasphingomonas puruogangriensis TaxID=3096155 RepID=UPI002FC9188F
MAIIGAALGERSTIGLVRSCIEQRSVSAVPRDAVAFEIGDVPDKWSATKSLPALADRTRLDDHTTRYRRTAFAKCGATTSPQMPGTTAPGGMMDKAGPGRGTLGLRGKARRLDASGAPIPNLPRRDPKIVLFASHHGAPGGAASAPSVDLSR